MSSTATLPHRCCCVLPTVGDSRTFRGPRTPQSGLDRRGRESGEGVEGFLLEEDVGRQNVVGRAANEAGGSQGCFNTVGGAALQLERAPRL